MLPGAVTFDEARDLARQAEEAGAESIWLTDLRRDPYLLSAAALDGTRSVQAGPKPGFEIPVYVSGVNPLMTQAAGEVADGFAAHAFNTPEYLRDVLTPALEKGAAAARRDRPLILLYLACAPDRETAANQMY